MVEREIGETVICYLEVKKSKAYYDPVTSTQISIYGPTGVIDVSATDMTKEATGKYSYDYQTVGKVAGNYKVLYAATDGVKITTVVDRLKLVPI